VGCERARIVKSLLFLCDGEPVLALTSDEWRVDTDLLRKAAGRHQRPAEADAVRDATGHAIGGMPPFGRSCPLRAVADTTLTRYENLWAAAGTPDTVLELPSTDFVRCVSATVADFTCQTEECCL